MLSERRVKVTRHASELVRISKKKDETKELKNKKNARDMSDREVEHGAGRELGITRSAWGGRHWA